MNLPLRKTGVAAVALLCSTTPLMAALSGVADSSTFTSQFDGNEIWDGATTQNQWVQNGGHTNAALALSGSNLVTSPNANNGWVEHDGGATPWEGSSGHWTVEVNLRLNDTNPGVNDGIVLWGERDGNRGVLWIQGTSITDINGNVIAGGMDNTDGFHAIRVAYDSDDNLHHVWRDGVLLSGAGVDIDLPGGTNSRLIIGDCCTGIGNPIDQYELGYVRYQADMSLAPIPEPSTSLLGGLALALLGLRRRR